MNRLALLAILACSNLNVMHMIAQSEFSSNLIGVGVVVTDIEESLEFYTQVIGMKIVEEFDVDADFSRASGLSNGIPFHVHVLKLEDSPQANQWKLMSFDSKPGHSRPAFVQDDTGMQYITIMVNSLEPFLERIRKYGVKLLGETPVQLDDEQHFVLLQDPDGTFIELIGPLN